MGNWLTSEQLTVSTASVGFTVATVGVTATFALITVADASVRMGDSTNAPTGSVGALFHPGDTIPLVGHETILNTRFIRDGSTDAVLDGRFGSGFDVPFIASGSLRDDQGRVSVVGAAASDAAEAGNPIQIGLSVDEGSPTAAGEGDVRRVRGSAEGDLMVQPTFEGANISSAQGAFVQGPVASDAAEAGNPLQIGGSVDDTSPTAAGEGDVRRFRSTPKGNQIVELYKGEDALAPIGAMPGASEVKNLYNYYTATSRKTIVTPSGGKKIRVISISIQTQDATEHAVEIYFGTGAGVGSTDTQAIAVWGAPATANTVVYFSWPDGGGPVAATANDVLSAKTTATLSNGDQLVVQYREE
jgi:hypothetical protein